MVFSLVNKLSPQEEFFPMVVRRSNVLVDALRRIQRSTFAPEKTLQVPLSNGLLCDYLPVLLKQRYCILVKKVVILED